MLIQLYWILGYLGCALFTILICPPIMWMLDSRIRPGTYKDMWDYAYKGDDNPHPVLIFLLWLIFIFFLFAFFIIDLPILVKYIFGRKKRYIASVNEKELKDRENYVREVEHKYQNIMAKERANDFKDYRW